jgi:hypothetical protein
LLNLFALSNVADVDFSQLERRRRDHKLAHGIAVGVAKKIDLSTGGAAQTV